VPDPSRDITHGDHGPAARRSDGGLPGGGARQAATGRHWAVSGWPTDSPRSLPHKAAVGAGRDNPATRLIVGPRRPAGGSVLTGCCLWPAHCRRRGPGAWRCAPPSRGRLTPRSASSSPACEQPRKASWAATQCILWMRRRGSRWSSLQLGRAGGFSHSGVPAGAPRARRRCRHHQGLKLLQQQQNNWQPLHCRLSSVCARRGVASVFGNEVDHFYNQVRRGKLAPLRSAANWRRLQTGNSLMRRWSLQSRTPDGCTALHHAHSSIALPSPAPPSPAIPPFAAAGGRKRCGHHLPLRHCRLPHKVCRTGGCCAWCECCACCCLPTSVAAPESLPRRWVLNAGI
jgi:hypothetical protein